MADEIVVGVKVQGNASAELNKITKSVKQTSSAFQVFKGVLGAEALIGSIKTLARVAVSGFKSMVNQAKDLETIRTRFEVLTQSIKGGKELLEDLQEFAASTPFKLPGLADAASTLLAFQFSQDEVIDRLQVLGDIAAGAGQPIKDIALIFGQVNAAGKLTGERFIQLAERGVNVGPAIAKSMNIAEKEVSEFISKGKVSFEIFDEAVKSLTSDTGIFFEGMVKQSKTLEGVLSTLSDNFDLISSDIGGEFLPAIKAAAIELLKFAQENRESIKQFAASVADALPMVLAFADATVRSFTFIFRAVKASTDLTIGAFKAVAAAQRGDFAEAMVLMKRAAVDGASGAASAIDSLSEDTLLGNLTTAVLASRISITGMTEDMKKQEEATKKLQEANERFLTANKETFEQLRGISQKFAEEDLENTIALIQERSDAEIAALTEANSRKLLSTEEFNELRIASERKKNNALDKIESKRQKAALADQNKFFSTASTLQRSKSKELQAIGKAAAITQVAIDTPPAVSSSFRFGSSIGGPFLGAVFAGIAAAAQAVQAAQIAGVPLATGGVVPPGFPNDNFSARLTSGEAVVPRGTTEDLRSFLDEQAGTKQILSGIMMAIQNQVQQTVVQVGDDTIIDAIRNAQDEGRVIA